MKCEFSNDEEDLVERQRWYKSIKSDSLPHIAYHGDPF